MSIPDYILCGFLIWGFISGFRKGLVLQLALIGGIVAGIWLALHGSEKAADWLNQHAGLEGRWLKQLGFILVFLVVYVLAFLGGKSLSGALNLMMLGLFNKLAGGVFGVVKMSLALSLLLFFGGYSGWIDSGHEMIRESSMYGSLNGFGEQLYRLLR